MTKVKICGVTTEYDAQACVDAGADFLGFVLSDSPRQVSFGQLERLSATVGESCHRVGVFTDETDLIDFSLRCQVELDYYQVYFDPTGINIRLPRLGLIRAHWMNGDARNDLAHMPVPTLLDFKHSDVNAMRKQLAPHAVAVGNAVILAGKLTPDNVAGVIRELAPWGVDVARGTEAAPGKKDHELVRRFVENVRSV
ncbi:MAG: phosphoribosylanthranilate isomerase [Candidatus Zixiibacteriota bacterium]